MAYQHIAAAFFGAVWAILPAKLAEIRALLEMKMAGHDVPPDQVQAVMAAARSSESRSIDSLAVIPILGTIVPRGNLMAESSGGVSVERLTQTFRQAMADPSVKGVLLDISSPGGAVDGIEEFSSEVYRARGQKPIYAVANSLAASAAYWIAASAERVFVTPSGEIGSIGVFSQHNDVSKALEIEGVKPTLISAGRFKVDGNPFEPLTDTARAHVQERVNDFYGMFTRSVARGRGVSAETVRAGFGEGRVVGARAAVSEGMADEVGTFDRALNALAYRVRQGTPAGKVAALADGQGGTIYIGGDFTSSTSTGATLVLNGDPVADADLDEAEASKAAEHAEDAPAGLSAVEQADIDRRRRRARAAALRVAAR